MILTDDSDYWLSNMSWDYFKGDPVLEEMLRNRMRFCEEVLFCNMINNRKEGIEIEIKMKKNVTK